MTISCLSQHSQPFYLLKLRVSPKHIFRKLHFKSKEIEAVTTFDMIDSSELKTFLFVKSIY